jgi:two-component system, NarL family, response regulator YdfI
LIRVLLSVPPPALRAGLRSLLSADAEIKIIDKQDDIGTLTIKADVVITTSALIPTLPNTDAAATTPTAMLFLRDTPLDSQWAAPAAIPWGVLPLDASAGELCAAVHALAEGLIVGTSELLFASEDEVVSARGPLTERESEVLGLLAKGLANKQIALALGISEHTVKFHVSSIYTKLDATNRTQAVREGLRNGWIVL